MESTDGEIQPHGVLKLVLSACRGVISETTMHQPFCVYSVLTRLRSFYRDESDDTSTFREYFVHNR